VRKIEKQILLDPKNAVWNILSSFLILYFYDDYFLHVSSNQLRDKY
jgi:hypothetical protein